MPGKAPDLEAEMQVFAMFEETPGFSRIAESGETPSFWDIVVTARNPETGEVLPVLEIENLSRDEAEDWVNKLELHSSLEAEWVGP